MIKIKTSKKDILPGDPVTFSTIKEAQEFIQSANMLNQKLQKHNRQIAIVDEFGNFQSWLDDLKIEPK